MHSGIEMHIHSFYFLCETESNQDKYFIVLVDSRPHLKENIMKIALMLPPKFHRLYDFFFE